MHQLLLLSLGVYALQVSASPALPFPPLLPLFPSIGTPSLPTLPVTSIPTSGVVPPPIVLTSVPGVSVPSAGAATAFPSLPGVSAPSAGLPSSTLPGTALSGSLISTLEFPTGIGSLNLPTSSFPALPTLTNTALISSISAILSGITIPTGLPGIKPLPTDLSLSYTSSLGELPTLPIPSLLIPSLTLPTLSLGTVTGLAGKPVSIVTNLSSAIEILLLLIRLIQETINNGGVRVPGVAELGIDVGTNLLGVLLKVVADILDKAGAVGAIAI